MAKEREEARDVAGVPVEKQKHQNIFEALSAFQGENPEIKRTKEFGKEGEKMHWWYAPLDEVLKTVRPLLARHGLSVTWTGKEKELVCVLYHETYEAYYVVIKENASIEGATIKEHTLHEKNVIRSLPITVRRSNDMKEVGSDSTYARRYTLAEVLGIAPDEDNDIGFDEERGKKLESFAFGKAKEGVQKSKTVDDLLAKADFFHKDLKAIEDKKVPSLGLKVEQYNELLALVGERQKEIEKSLVGKGKSGDNDDADGQAVLPQ